MTHFSPGTRIAVLTPRPVRGALEYLAPDGGCWLGAFVEVPLGRGREIGVVWGPGEAAVDESRLRTVTRVLDVAPMGGELREFLERAGAYTLTPLPAMLRLATRSPGLGEAQPLVRHYAAGPQEPPRLTPARQAVLEAIKAAPAPLSSAELSQKAGASTAVIRGMVRIGALREVHVPRDGPFPPLDPNRPGKALTSEQSHAAAQICAQIQKGGYGTTLLRGVTGSGKTEVYLEAVATCLRAKRQGLVLLPEIALTTEFLQRVETRFGARPAEWHSGMAAAQRRRVWKMASSGGASLVVGARSALFLPFRDLGLIVVDEEHDGSYKQEEGVLYNARDMAVLRASLCKAQVVLASATPSLESWANAEAGKYLRVDLTNRFGAAVLPEMRAIDMRSEALSSGHWISPTLSGEVRNALERGEQALLFLNRRGYAPVTLCRACGEQIGCPHCDARLVAHRARERLVCHQCGWQQSPPNTCPSCNAQERMVAIGPGVERIEEEARALFPDARIALLSSDLFSSAGQLKTAVAAIAGGEANLIIGTQLVAKGHNFPSLTLVGVIDADLGLQGSDLRAAERTFQLLRQVAGRAGRAQRPGLALLQTYQPEHPVIRATLAGDEQGFWQAEARAREAAGMPPYGRLAGVILSGSDMQEAFEYGHKLAQNAGPLLAAGASLYGPAPAPISRIRGRHRVRLLIKAPKGASLQNAITAWLAPHPLPKELRLSIDIDPQSFL